MPFPAVLAAWSSFPPLSTVISIYLRERERKMYASDKNIHFHIAWLLAEISCLYTSHVVYTQIPKVAFKVLAKTKVKIMGNLHNNFFYFAIKNNVKFVIICQIYRNNVKISCTSKVYK
jgi:hypothetical protein